jgi:hypothetical protein
MKLYIDGLHAIMKQPMEIVIASLYEPPDFHLFFYKEEDDQTN